MKSRLFLGFFLILLFSCFVSCQNIGKVNDTHYYDVDGEYKLLKKDFESCLNSFECINDSCIDGICQSKFTGLEIGLGEGSDLLNQLLALLGKECDPLDQSYHCEGTEAFLCGVNGQWESKGNVEGECGYSSGGSGGSSGGGSGGSSGSSMDIVLVSPLNGVTYSHPLIELKVFDSKKRARYWEYSLNNKSKIGFTPNTTIVASEGKNVLTVYARKYSSSSSGEVIKRVNFNVVLSSLSGYCGDGICQDSESCETCSDDCGLCPIKANVYCGDDICDVDESSSTCPEDCDKNSRIGYFIFLMIIIFLVAGILALIGYLLYKKFYNKKMNNFSNTK